MTTVNEIGDLRTDLRDTLDRSEKWLRKAAALPGIFIERRQEVERDAEVVQRLRTRAASTLINVALLGAFSSGKSFLLSGLQGGLELFKVPSGTGLAADKFVGLLPSSPVPTNACPARVVPVDEGIPFDASGTGYLRVRFVDSDDWEDVGNSLAPSVVAAYVAVDANLADRLRTHRDREVAEVEILLSDFKIPAMLYDLPGYGAPNPIHDTIVKNAMNDADCFIYVSHASRALSANDLDLIRFLYQHYLLSRKRVVWVVTAIDSAMQLDHEDTPAWQATIARNNAYLKQSFVLQSGQPDIGFIGEGFIPVSPALEARAALLTSEGAEAVTARRHIAESRMDSLRQDLQDLISRDTGRNHIAAVARNAWKLVAPRERVLAKRLETERLPIEELKRLLESERDRLQQLEAATPGIRERLEHGLESYVKRASRPFGRLAAHLHSVLDVMIKSTDVRKPSKANQVQVAKTQALQTWMVATNGPAILGGSQLERFKEEMLRAVRAALGDSSAAGQLPDYSFDVTDLTVPRPEGRGIPRGDLLQRTAAVIGVSTPLAAGGTWLSGLVSSGAVLPYAGLVAGAAAIVYGSMQFHKDKATSLEVTQAEWITALDKEVAELQRQFELAIGMQGMNMIDNLIDNLDQYREQLEDSVDRARQRITDPKTQGRQELVNELEPLCREGSDLKIALRALSDQ
ncbi:MAG: hypothetical protein ACRDTG_27025 [Pseudonocardiaceae bacterium]